MQAPMIYVSVDVEADGPIPGWNSMLSLGAYAFYENGDEVGSFYMNLLPLQGAVQDPDTMNWWATQPEAWAALMENRAEPAYATIEFSKWLSSMPGFAVFVAAPVAFDIMFVYWYLRYFTGASPLGFRAIDIRSFAMGKLGREYNRTSKSKLPAKFRPDKGQHTHKAIDDAVEQAQWFLRLLNDGKTT